MELAILSPLCCHVEVQDEDALVGLGNEQILRLDVPVADALLVEVVQAGHDLLKDVLRHLLSVDVLRLRGQVVKHLHTVF